MSSSIPTAAKEDSEKNMRSIFQSKYDEFANQLLDTIPEKERAIHSAIALSESERINKFRDIVVVDYKGEDSNPGTILPGVSLTDELWASLGPNNKKRIWEYVRLLSMCCFLEGMFGENTSKPAWIDDTLREWSKRLERVDFESILKKFSKMFIRPNNSSASSSVPAAEAASGSSESDTSGNPTPTTAFPQGSFPKLPERLLKGQLAKLANEIIRLIKPEDLGLTPEIIRECEASPSRAFEILIQVVSKNPGIIQNMVEKIGKSLQKKVQNGQIRPQEIAREAEELMKEFSNMPEFVEVMSSFKSAFGFEDMDIARQVGREGSARLSIARQRLRTKLETKKNKKGM